MGDNEGDSRTAELEIGKDITISAPGTYGVTVFGNKTTETVTIAGKINAVPAAAVSGNGSTGYGNTTITIEPTAELTSEQDAAIYHPQSGTLTINGGKITGVGGIEAKAGDTTITMSGSPTVTATGEVNHDANSNGTSTEGYAIAVVENAAYAGGATVTIGSGTYTGAIGIVTDNEVAADKKGSISITSGTFSTDPTTYVIDGYIVKKNSDTQFEVLKKENLTSGVYTSDPSGALASRYYVSSIDTENNLWTVSYNPPSDSGSSGGSSSSKTETVKNPDGSTTTTVTDKKTGTVTETTTGKPVTDEDGNTTQTKTETVTNKDGSTTETVTETVKGADGSTSETQTVVSTDKDGATTTTETVKATDPTGTTATKTTETNAEGETTTSVEAAVSDKALTEAAKDEAPVTLPVEVAAPKAAEADSAPVVKVEVPSTVSTENTVKVEIPVENPTPGTVAIIVKEDGTEEIVKTSVLGENGVVLTLDGSATVKIVDNSKHFEDVHPVDHWAGDTIDFVASREIFSGTGKNTFSPDVAMTRAMLMTVLARYDGEDTTTGDTWYEKGMDWAKANGVSDGTNPDANITREQLATMLYRYAGSPEHDGAIDRFPDADAVSSYAAEAMRWAVSNGLIDGMDDGTLNPQGDATRAQVAAVLARFCSNQA